MKKTFTLITAIQLLSLTLLAQERPISGFKTQNISIQRDIEQKFDAGLNKENIGVTIKELSANPHHLGSKGSKAVAESVLNKFKSYGWNAKIETYYVLFPTPKTRSVELLGNNKYHATLEEQAVKEDLATAQQGQLPPYNAWGADGDVSAGLIFVNYGLPADYDKLERLGVSVKGKIVIAKYGRSWRGIKPKIAYEHGAVGCIIYSDPKDDGFVKGDVYPQGAFKPEFAVQRGSVMDMVIYPGDPLTPGIGATKDAKRIERAEAKTILKIPVQPISYHDALPLLTALKGQVVPSDWSGGLPVTYHIGDGSTLVRLNLAFNWDIVPAYNVVAKLEGSKFKNQWIIRGNHHDAWVNGAADPVSGLASLLEEAKSIGLLAKAGIKPKRTLVYIAWDGEEQSLLGSTEWVEDHAAELNNKAVAYINSDGNGRGFLEAGGSHALENFVSEISKEVKDPQVNSTIFERWKANKVISTASLSERKKIQDNQNIDLGALGTGSDYSAFLQHLGIPTLSLGFGGEDEGGEYHTNFDTYDNFIKFKDPGFEYGLALSQTAGRAVLRLANADVLPFNFTNLQVKIATYVTEVTALAKQLKETAQSQNTLISNGAYQLANDPKENLKNPPTQVELPEFDFKALNAAVDSLKTAASHLNQSVTTSLASGANTDKLNTLLFQAEKQLLQENGLPGRPWYKHSIYAPGLYTGYGVKTLPGVREAIEQYHVKEVQEQISVLTASILKLSQFINSTKHF
ncbi:transferrin receptor-like dimerization domain-containing protein [Pedobacter jeongneungensis]|uniref:transferrin receptor-like dimerization domain-containing protein n=1 Tax=Pedobacter jeongneungensis TaxID=947309 RepID=UPI00046A1376|nr:transferrin receptor-like dimerization domain-containing protein [Pedobacter jeongneungensis]